MSVDSAAAGQEHAVRLDQHLAAGIPVNMYLKKNKQTIIVDVVMHREYHL